MLFTNQSSFGITVKEYATTGIALNTPLREFRTNFVKFHPQMAILHLCEIPLSAKFHFLSPWLPEIKNNLNLI